MHSETSAAISVQTAQLEEQVSALNDALAQEDAKVAALRKKVGAADAAGAAGTVGAAGAPAEAPAAGGAAAAALDALLPELRARIIEVYERCGFKANASSDTISMLTALEGKLESLLASLAGLEPEYVSLKEKEKERERRIRVRAARLAHAAEEHERKQAKMLQRAQAPVVRRVGKPDMSRSFLIVKRKEVVVVDHDAERRREELLYGLRE